MKVIEKPQWLTNTALRDEHMRQLITLGVPRQVLKTACGYTNGQISHAASHVKLRFQDYAACSQEVARTALVEAGFSAGDVAAALKAYPAEVVDRPSLNHPSKHAAATNTRAPRREDGQRGCNLSRIASLRSRSADPLLSISPPTDAEVKEEAIRAICAAAGTAQ